MSSRHLVAVVAAAALWGTIGITTRWIFEVESTSPLFLNFARIAIAIPVLLALGRAFDPGTLASQRPGRAARRTLATMALAGALLVGSQVAYFAAIRATGITIATLVTICLSPLVVVGASVATGRDVPDRRTRISVIAGIAGTALLVGFDPSRGGTPVGVGWALVAAALHGGSILCGRRLASEPPFRVTAVMFATGAIALAPVLVVVEVSVPRTAGAWAAIVYLGVVPTAFGYALLQFGLRGITAPAASVIAMLDPLVAAILAWAMFGETIGVTGVFGAALLAWSAWQVATRQADVSGDACAAASRSARSRIRLSRK